MATKQNTSSANPSSEDVTEQLAVIRSDLQELASLIADVGKAKGADVSGFAHEKAAQARATAKDGIEAARAQAANLQGQANDFVKNQPGLAIGIAAGVGFLIGSLGRRS